LLVVPPSVPIFVDEDDVKAATYAMFQLLPINKILLIMLNKSKAEIAKEITFLFLTFPKIILYCQYITSHACLSLSLLLIT
jgi:hypothetical protein